MSISIVTWGTGNVGCYAVRGVLNHPELERAARTVLDIVRHSQKEGRALLAYIKHELMKRLNGFDERHYGFPKFKLFMKELERHGLIRVITRDLVDWAFLPEVAEQEGVLDDEELGYVQGMNIVAAIIVSHVKEI